MEKLSCNFDAITRKYHQKLEYWFNLLTEIMPDYFFSTFSDQQIQDILPSLFNIHMQTGIQQIRREHSIILIYLKSTKNNLFTNARMMENFHIRSAAVHEANQPMIIDGVPRMLVIEYYEIGTIQSPLNTLLPKKEIIQTFQKKYKIINGRVGDLYDRLNWYSVKDLWKDRLIERMHDALIVEDQDWINVEVEEAGKDEIRISLTLSNCPQKGFYHKMIECMALNGIEVQRAYLRNFSFQHKPDNFYQMPVVCNTLYLKHNKRKQFLASKKLKHALWVLPHIKWVNMKDLLHQELVIGKGWSISAANLLRASAEFIRTQLSYVDHHAYTKMTIFKEMVLHEQLLKLLFDFFHQVFRPDIAIKPDKKKAFIKKIEKKIESVKTGTYEKDEIIKTIFFSLLNFIVNIQKTNFYVKEKTALSFRLNPDFMSFYEGISSSYSTAFPKDRPYGIFYFYRNNAIGYHVRFAKIARGGWRTVIPKHQGHDLERLDTYVFAKNEIYREIFNLAHTQNLKNKDIYEGGSKMICLLKHADKPHDTFFYEAQRSIARAFMDLINYDSKGRLKNKDIVDYLGEKEIIELGPDENMHDEMINWLSGFAKKQRYTLGDGFISGKPDKGINHKEFGVTSYGLHQYLLKTLTELNIDPAKDAFTVKLSGGPYGDVAGNILKLLFQKKGSKYLYPKLKVVAITDGPAAAYDPEGLDRQELLNIIHNKNLDSFSPEKLSGDGASIIFSDPTVKDGAEEFRFVMRKNGRLLEKQVTRDEYINIYLNNLMVNYADVFIPCGGRPATINMSNWQEYFPHGKASSRAVIEGANSYITPEARNALQDSGVWIIKDASANKCGVIASSYEILSGLMLSAAEFKDEKDSLVEEIMQILKMRAQKEADWLFYQYSLKGEKLTDLTDRLSREINKKNDEISNYLIQNPKTVKQKIIFQHLPPIFSEKYSNRLSRVPMEYKNAIVAVELATRIIYGRLGNIADEIAAVL